MTVPRLELLGLGGGGGPAWLTSVEVVEDEVVTSREASFIIAGLNSLRPLVDLKNRRERMGGSAISARVVVTVCRGGGDLFTCLSRNPEFELM